MVGEYDSVISVLEICLHDLLGERLGASRNGSGVTVQFGFEFHNNAFRFQIIIIYNDTTFSCFFQVFEQFFAKTFFNFELYLNLNKMYDIIK